MCIKKFFKPVFAYKLVSTKVFRCSAKVNFFLLTIFVIYVGYNSRYICRTIYFCTTSFNTSMLVYPAFKIILNRSSVRVCIPAAVSPVCILSECITIIKAFLCFVFNVYQGILIIVHINISTTRR